MKRILIAVGVAGALGVMLFVSLRGDTGGSGPRVYTEAVERDDIVRWVKASGKIDPRIKVNISAHVIGKIERLFVEEGDWIDAGAPFLELEPEAFVAARDQASAQVAIARSGERQAEIRWQDAELRLRRMQRLRDEGIASLEDLEQAELTDKSAALQREEAREGILQAQAALDKAQDDLSKATIFAPISGRVIALNAEEGEVVVSGTMNNPASVIGTIGDLSELLAEVDVDETEVAYLEEGQDATLEVDALPEREYAGRVVEIGSSGFERPQQPDVTFFTVKILLEEPDAALRPGMSVRAEVNTAERQATLTVPIQAVVDRKPVDDEAGEEIEVVFVVDEVGKVEQRAVTTGLSDATRVEILEGLEEGEEVVTGPYRELKELDHGASVRPRESGDDADDDAEE